MAFRLTERQAEVQHWLAGRGHGRSQTGPLLRVR